MRSLLVQQIAHVFGQVVATVIGLGTFAVLLLVLRRLFRWPFRVEPFSVVEDLLSIASSRAGEVESDPTRKAVNVEYRDAAGVSMDLGPHVTVRLRNGRGRSFDLHDGVFAQCDPGRIKAGGSVVLSIQDGLIRESLVVQVDVGKETLFVRSKLNSKEMLEKINRSRSSDLPTPST